MSAAERAEAVLAAVSETPVEDAMLLCAELHLEGQSELAARVLGAFRDAVYRDPPASGWARERVEILFELEAARRLGKSQRELVSALARALLADDTHAIDELAERLVAEKKAPPRSTFDGLPRLRQAWADALEVPESKRRIHAGVLMGLALLAYEVLSRVWDLWPSILHFLGVQPR